MTRTAKTDDYDLIEIEQDRLCMNFAGAVHVHPDRWELFNKMVIGVKDVCNRR